MFVLPRILGALMMLAGLCWLAFLSPTLTNYLSPYNLALGLLGEASVSLWLLAMGVNVQRWKQPGRFRENELQENQQEQS
jgi:hypothetical protein